MISWPVFEGRYNTGQKIHQIGQKWLCVLADISKTGQDIILKIMILYYYYSPYLISAIESLVQLIYWNHHCNEGCNKISETWTYLQFSNIHTYLLPWIIDRFLKPYMFELFLMPPCISTMYDFHDSTDTLKFWTEKTGY